MITNEYYHTKLVCIVCGIPFIEGKGFVGEHEFPCANERYNWAFVKESSVESTLKKTNPEPKGDSRGREQ